MYIDNEDFEKWMAKLSKKLTEIGQDLKSLINTDKVLDDNEKILDNQDLAFLLKVSFRTLQRYRISGQLPYFTIGKKTYYRANDIRAFVRERADSQSYKQFEKANQLRTDGEKMCCRDEKYAIHSFNQEFYRARSQYGYNRSKKGNNKNCI